ncbi:keratin-like protein KRT222 [Enoplosus armatus]|uniref:keratin-like protein KRT222 n=1 Tax=Enoplosus armatus TaxID=215367 RepID=UPI003995DC67
MDLLQDSSHTMLGLNTRLKGFLEQVNRLQEANRRLEAQIADWGVRSTSRSRDWSQQEQTVKELRTQVSRLLMENAQLALQSDSMKSTAAAIQARCETEEMNTMRLEQQVALLRESKRKADQSSMTLQEEAAWAQVSLGGTALREARAELAEARKQWHSLQVEIETLHALEKGLESSLQNTQRLYSSQLQDLTQVIAGLESELEQVRSGLATQRQRHSQLLNTKMRLEREIATYRRLLEREEGRYMGRNGQPMGLRPWRSSMEEPKENGLENGFSDPAVTPDEPKSEPLPEIPSLLPADNGLKKGILHRQQSLVILTEPEQDKDLPISTVKTQEILQGNVVQESAEGHGTIETEKIDKVIKQWEGSFFRGNPKLRKKSVSLRFDLHMAAADEGCAQTKQDSLPDVEVRLIMKRSRSIPTITQ